MAKAKKGIGKKRSFILSVGDDGAILLYTDGRRVLRRMFAPSPEPADTRSFDSLFQSDPNAPISVMVDTMDQTYVQQTLPPVSRLNIDKIIKRRLDRDFGASDVKGALPLGRSSEGRREWMFLFISVAYAPPLSHWLNYVIDRPNPFKGVYLLPVEAEHVLARLQKATTPKGTKQGGARKKPKPKKGVKTAGAPAEDQAPQLARWHILVSHNKVGGFRQIVFKDRKLAFTRMAQPIGEATPEVIAGNIEQELNNTSEYLKRLAFNPTEGLEITVVVAREIRQYLTLDNPNVRKVSIYTPHELAKLLGVEQAADPADHFGDVVFAACLAMHYPPRMRFVLPLARRIMQLYALRQTATISASLLVPCMVLAMIWFGVQSWRMAGDISYAQEKLKEAEARKVELLNEKLQMPPNIDEIVEQVALTENFTKDFYTPLSTVASFSTLLEEDALVRRLEWSNANSLAGGKRKGRNVPPVEAMFSLYYENSGNADQFIKELEAFQQKAKEVFEGYDVSYSGMKGAGAGNGNRGVRIDFNEVQQQEVQPTRQEQTVTFTIRGPKKVKKANEEAQ